LVRCWADVQAKSSLNASAAASPKPLVAISLTHSKMENIFKIIDSYPDEFFAIKKQAKKYIRNDSNIDNNERVNILHRPWVAPLNWGLMIYKGADIDWINQVEDSIKKPIPTFYKSFLTKINGCFLYDISMFGLIHSLTRTYLQCHDLTTANIYWIKEYDFDQSFFHFGSGHYSYEENTGYFYGQNKIISVRKNGKFVNEWTNFSDFLNDELVRAENKMLKGVPKKIRLVVTE
jgi:hypothetical protein